MPKRMVILAVLTSLLLVASACNDDDESSVTTPKDVSCLQLGDTKCDLAGDGRAAVMVCSIIEATKNKEWVVATKCDLAECCYMETCVSVADGVLHDAPNCELGTSGDSCSNHKDCSDTYYCSDYFCTLKKVAAKSAIHPQNAMPRWPAVTKAARCAIARWMPIAIRPILASRRNVSRENALREQFPMAPNAPAATCATPELVKREFARNPKLPTVA